MAFLGIDLGIGTLGTILLWVLISITVGGSICGVIVWFFWNKSYNQKVVVWGKIQGVPQKLSEYPAKWISVGKAGDKLLYVRKAKRWQLPSLRSGQNEWHFWERALDREWINIQVEDVDVNMQKMKIKFIDGDVRMQRLGIEKVLKDRHQKKRDWGQIIANITYIVFFILIFIALVVLFSRMTGVAEAQTKSAEAITKMAGSIDKFYEERTSDGLSPADVDRGGGVLIPSDSDGGNG